MSLNNPAGALGTASGSYITMGENYYIFKNATRIQRDGDGVDVVCASWGITVLGNIAYSVHLM